MELNIEAILMLIKKRYRNNKSFFAETIGVDRSYLNSILNKRKTNFSPKVCNSLIKYCKENNLNYEDYIFLK